MQELVIGVGVVAVVLLLLHRLGTGLWNVATRMLEKSSDRPDRKVENPNVVITLVHGTFVPRTQWVQEGSPLRMKLLDTLGPNTLIRRFRWSGSNSLIGRSRAARRLQEHLYESVQRWPDAKHFIIAHSHGGNIAYYALRDPWIESRMSGTVCLSTPFIHARRRYLGSLTSIIHFAAPFGLILFLLILIDGLVLQVPDDWGWLLTLTAFLGASVIYGLWGGLAEWLVNHLRFGDVEPSKVLIVRASGDEASSALAVLPFLSWFVSLIWVRPAIWVADAIVRIGRWSERTTRYRKRFRPWAAIGFAVFFVYFVFSPGPTSHEITELGHKWSVLDSLLLFIGLAGLLVAVAWIALRLVTSMYSYLVILGILVGGIFFAPLPVIFAIALLPFGPEFALAGLLLEITTEASPPGTWSVHQMPNEEEMVFSDTVPAVETGNGRRPLLMHSAGYLNPQALHLVSGWILERIAPIATHSTRSIEADQASCRPAAR